MTRRIGQKGHNLLEAVIAGMIFAVTTVALMGVWNMQFKAMLKSKETAVSAFLAERIMEECIAAGYEAVDNIYTTDEVVTIRSRTKSGISNAEYIARKTVQIHPSDPSQKMVSVEVIYNDGSGPQNVEYHTYLHEDG